MNYAEAFEMFAFDPDPAKCMCKGSGWALSDRDSWHRCPEHHTKDSRHPEDDGGDYPQCIECWDGENYPCDKCPKCGAHVREQMSQGWNDEPQVHDDVTLFEHLPEPDGGLPESEIPF